jgi:phosphatidylglycerol:prolipoprotein diacylglycerol transferase
MRQVLFEIPGVGVKIFGYGLMLFFAFIAAMNLAALRARRAKLDPEVIYDLALWVFIGGLVGARGFYVAQYWGTKVRTFWEIFEIWRGGIVLYGSLLGAAIAFLTYRAFRPFPIRPTLDAIAPSMALGLALGRIGCFLNGCCYGDPCTLPWAVQFPRHSPAWEAEVTRGMLPPSAETSLPLHPTQIYSAIDGLVLMFLLLAFTPLRKRDGQVMALLLTTYPITRFLIEHLRNDEGVFALGMTISQLISVGIFAASLGFWYYLSRLPAGLYADQAEEPAPAAVGEDSATT